MTLFSSILFSVFTSAMFFIKGQFFSGSGTTDLLSYFSTAPYICIIVIPCLCYRPSISIYDDFIPESRLKRLLKNFLHAFLHFSLIVLFMLPVCLLVNLAGSVDFGQVFLSMLCLLFYGACLIALCLFVNTFFQNNIIAFAVSALFLAVFNSIHLVPLYINVPGILNEICKKLSFAWHFDAASKGIFDSRDILWLCLWTAFFIFAAHLIVELRKGLRLKRPQKKLLVGFLLIFVFAIADSGKYFVRFDFSKNKSYSVGNYTKQIISNLDDNLNITYYRSNTLSKLYPQIRDVTDFLNSFSVMNKKINYVVKDPDKDEKIKTMLQNYGISSQQLQNTGVNSTEFVNVYSSIVLEYKGNTQIIPFLMSSKTLEYDLDIRLKSLLSGKSLGINIIIANGMSIDDDYSLLVPWFNSQGIQTNVLYLEDPAFSTMLEQAQGPLLVIGDSEVYIENAVAIENYILNKNSNAVFAVSPYSAAIDDDWSITANKRTNLVEILENWGVRFTDNIAADISCARITMYSDDDTVEILNYPLWISLLPQQYCTGGMTLFWPVCLELSQNAMPYLVTSSMGYSYQTDKASPSRLIETNPFFITVENSGDKTKGTQIIGAQITGPLTGLFNYGSSSDSNIIVIPDQYFLNTLMTGYIGGDYGDYRNFDFISNCVLSLNGENDLAALQSKTSRDTSLYKITDLSQLVKLMRLVYAVIFIILPLVYVIIFVGKRIFRKKAAIND